MLFNARNKIQVGDLNFEHIDKKNIESMNDFYKFVRVDKITANATQGLLLFGMNNYWCIYENYLVICHIYRGVVSLVTFPFNKHGYMPINDIVAFMRKYNIKRVRWVLDTYFKNNDVTLVKSLFKIIKLYTEYVIDVEALCNLSGHEYKNIRKDCSRLGTKYNVGHRFCSIQDKEMVEEVYEIWCNKSGVKYRNIYDRTYLFNMFCIAPEKFLLFFDLDKRNPIGFVNYFEINAKSVYCGFLKFDKGYYGLPRYMEHERAKLLREMGFKYTNIDADDNSVGLASFKESLRPIYKMTEYELHLL